MQQINQNLTLMQTGCCTQEQDNLWDTWQISSCAENYFMTNKEIFIVVLKQNKSNRLRILQLLVLKY